MAEKKFAFESGEVSVAFTLDSGLGDAIIARKVFDAIIELAPNCRVDIFYVGENRRNFAQAFYGGSKNLNLILPRDDRYAKIAPHYDVGLNVVGYNFIQLFNANAAKLNTAAPKLLAGLAKIVEYNNRHIRRYASCVMCVPLVHMISARIVNKNCYTFLSCGGALPINDNHVEISLSPEGERAFRKLKLRKNYITIGSNLQNTDRMTRHTLKEWSTAYATEYITLINRHLPQIQVVQVGGGGCIKFANADVHLIDADLELVKHVLANSLLHVDCESGLVHLATQLGTKCLVLFGPTDEKYYAFKQNLNLVSDFCTPCCFAWDDGSKCLRGNKEPPCMLTHTSQKVFEVTRNWLEHSGLKNNA